MQLFYCDESNLNVSNPFLVYGGLIIDSNTAVELSSEIDKIRDKFDVATDFHVKFNPGPAHLSHADFIEFKQSLIELAVYYDAKFIVSIVSHKIAESPDIARRFEINRVSYHFNCYLNRVNDSGIILIDRFSDKEIDDHLREKFSKGISGNGLPFSDTIRLDKIIGFHYSSIGQSHFTSLIDIILGSFRFSINTVHSKKHQDSAVTILNLLKPLFIMDDSYIDLISFSYSPQKIKVAKYRQLYLDVDDFLTNCRMPPRQKITSG